MTTRTWNGTTADFATAADWSPTGVPVSGDTAVINSGTVSLSSVPSGVSIQLNELAGATTSTTLAINGLTLDPSVALFVTNQNTYNFTPPTISTSGATTFAGTESFYSGKINFAIAAGSTLTNSGTMNFYAASPVTSGGGTLVNNGTIALVNPANAPQIPVFGDATAGTGTIALGEKARVTFSGSVSSGQTLLLNDGANGNEIVQLNAPGKFNGVISGFSVSDLIAVVNTPYTNATYTSTGSNSGVLSLFSGATLEANLSFTGSYTLNSFGFVFNDFGNGQSNLQITTTGVNNQSGGLPPGFQNGGSGTVLPVYRFFDTKYGTHFFTSDLGEANNVIANRPDLTEETNGFGTVTQTNPGAEAVYRFFDKNFGTHFFTASASERDSLIANRSDLTYEPTSIFYEDATQQPGDLAVHRLFDTIHGTQFLTGDQAEYAGLTTQGSSTYRSDLHDEGVAFYAPPGSFKA